MKEIIEWKPARLLRDCLRVLGYHNRFTIERIEYRIDACSVGLTPLGPPAAAEAAEILKERGWQKVSILDIASGVGIIGLTINQYMPSTIEALYFADINIFNLNSLRRTVALNDKDGSLKNKVTTYLSDCLDGVPELKFDLIISNPPDFFIEDFNNIEMSGNTLGRYSVGNNFHKSFYENCHRYLKPMGEIWFIENRDAITEAQVAAFIKANPELGEPAFRPSRYDPKEIYWSLVGLRK